MDSVGRPQCALIRTDPCKRRPIILDFPKIHLACRKVMMQIRCPLCHRARKTMNRVWRSCKAYTGLALDIVSGNYDKVICMLTFYLKHQFQPSTWKASLSEALIVWLPKELSSLTWEQIRCIGGNGSPETNLPYWGLRFVLLGCPLYISHLIVSFIHLLRHMAFPGIVSVSSPIWIRILLHI